MVKDVERPETLPHSPEAEEATLAALLLDPTQLDTLGLTPADFFSVWNREIFRSMLALSRDNKPVTWVHMYESLIGQPGHPNKPGEEYLDVTYLREVFDSAITAVHLHADAALVREKSIKRALLMQMAQVTKKAQNGTKLSDLDAMLVEARAGLQEPEAVAADPSFSVADVINAEIEAEPWVLDGILGAGQLSILTAQPGRGKTTVAWHLVRAAVKGGTFIERDIQRGGVAYLCLEEGLDSVQGAYERLEIQETDQIRVLFGDAVRADPIGFLTRHIEMHRPSLVIADTMAQLLQIENLSDYSETSSMMGQLLDLCRRQRPDGTPRPHIMLLHHAGKSEGAVFLGSTAIQAAVDIHLHLEKQSGGSDARILTAEKQRAGQDTFPRTILTMTPEGNLEVDTAPVAAVKRGMEEQITEYLTDHPEPQTRAAILSNLTGDTTLRKKTLTAMKRAKTVVVDEMQKPPLYSLNSEQQASWTAGLIEKSPGKSRSPAPTNLSWTAGLFPKESPASPAVGVRKHEENVNEQKSPEKQKSPAVGVRKHEVAKMSIIDEREKMTAEERADEIYNDPFVWALIEEQWPPPGIDPETCSSEELIPERDTPAHTAMMLNDYLSQRGKTPKQQAVMDKYRAEPYDDRHNAVACIRGLEALTER